MNPCPYNAQRPYWTNRFGASKEQLEEAVEAVGNSVDAVAAYLNT
ncbi:DUF3606 domain-containing protein [Sphingobium fuliginis]|uniref:DUF3606 domain-containing protein n=1 Tax=Sphingobium fuliginis (strain ATCC 27551) TaxID=336203 RepID=A0A292ZP91_SPHSA|nr:DUF3606 domain-containing protein [Sphingobium fuliginis]GAY24675.1 hypothetical protein SFOMI_5260 [Sphingobium fuliginis]